MSAQFRRIHFRVGIALFLSVLMPGEMPTAAEPEETIMYWDVTHLFSLNFHNPGHLRRFYDTAQFAASLQGLVNRESPRLFIRFNREPDDFWWDYMTQAGGWLAGRRVKKANRAEDLVAHFRKDIKGVVVWDERVPATANVASTVAGCEDLICLRYDPSPTSLYSRLVAGPPRLPIVVALINKDASSMFTGEGIIPGVNILSTGSPKCDAYTWALRRYLERGNCNPNCMGYYLDGFWLECWEAGELQNHCLTNHDYVIAKRGFIFDLDVWNDEAPIDDPKQKPGTDANTLQAILRAAYEKSRGEGMIHIAGFPPWAYKYTNHQGRKWKAGGTHETVATEWKFAEIISCFNGYADADALAFSSMANASFIQHYPLQDRYAQNPKPVFSLMKDRGYVTPGGRVTPKRYFAFYVGDYDSAAWMYWMIPRLWGDSARGQVPLSWGFNPNLCERNPLAMVYTRETRTPNDFFVAGNSGAGYLNPGFLTPPRPHSKLPSGLEPWRKHCKSLFRQWDVSLTGFILDGNAPGLSEEGLAAYADFSPDGIVTQKTIARQGVSGKMPFLKTSGDLPYEDPEDAARVIVGRFGESRPQFITFRAILKSPSWFVRVADLIRRQTADDPIEIVDLYTLLWLIRQHEAAAGGTARAKTRYSGVREVKCSPGNLQGIRPVLFVDGHHQVVEIAGRQAWQVPAHEPSYYFYLEVDDGFFCRARVPLEVRITYLDTGIGNFSIQYDSFDPRAAQEGVYKEAPAIQRENSGQWKTVRRRLEDARFSNQQNADCDLRFFTAGRELFISEVEIEKVP